MNISNKHAGMKAEEYFRELLAWHGTVYSFDDDWYDFSIYKAGSHEAIARIELKSCRISIAKGGKAAACPYTIGRFDFTREESRKLLVKNKVWIAFIVRHFDQFILLGLQRADKIPLKKRYYTIHQTRCMNLKPIGEMLDEVS